MHPAGVDPQPRPPSPVDAEVARLTGAAVARVATAVEGVHMAVLQRVHATTRTALRAARGPAVITAGAAGAQVATTAGVYSTVRIAARLSGAAAGHVLARRARPVPAGEDAPTPPALSALNAAVGDHLASHYPGIALPLRLTPPATPARGPVRLVIFVPGLAETERSWEYRSRQHWGTAGVSYASRMAARGWAPVQARYNSGRHISDTAAELDGACEALVDGWDGPVAEMALVGHSMGGLVARAALHRGHARSVRWPALVRSVVALGSPHLGADLERLANVAAWVLGGLPETRPLAALANGRSPGIKDLRFGYLQAADWEGAEPDALLRDRGRALTPVPHVRYLSVAATIGRQEWVGRVLGDGLVRPGSATGRQGGRTVPMTEHVQLRGLHHMDLLNHPAVDAQLARWLP
jgi:PGAP1-like protein